MDNRKRKLSELYSEPIHYNTEQINNLQQISNLQQKIKQLELEINFYKEILQQNDYSSYYIS